MIKIDEKALTEAEEAHGLALQYGRRELAVRDVVTVYLAHDPAIAAMTRVIIDLDGNVPCAICRYGRPHATDCPVALAKAHWTEERPACRTWHARAVGTACTNCGHMKEAHDHGK